MSVAGNGTAQSGLGGAQGYGEIEVPRGDDTSMQLDLSAVFENGLNYYGTTHTAADVFVNTNGTLSFGTAFSAYVIDQNTPPTHDLIAPFWGDVDTRLDGEGAESGGIWVDIDPVADVVSITWNEVGVYRRNGVDVNTFQLQLYDRGNGDFDIVFRYSEINWSIGTGENDAGARVGLFNAYGIRTTLIEIGADHSGLLGLPEALGNTGVSGLWLYEMRGGILENSGNNGLVVNGTDGDDTLNGSDYEDTITGMAGDDILNGLSGNDTLNGGKGRDRLIGGDGDDILYGGTTTDDLRDVIYGGAGNDTINGGYGNDELRGDAGDDTIAGGFGADLVIGGTGNDVLTGSAFGDEIHGGSGNDFINGGFGYDRVNGGAGADKFYHLGIADHGADWIQDYNAADGDVLFWGGGAVTADDFLIQRAETTNAGTAGAEEIFVTHIPSGNLLWALVDGDAQAQINIQIAGQVFDLLA
ncbi:nidogen-like domain-containing protein [Profundibacter sp.]